MIRVELEGKIIELGWEEWEERVRSGRIPPETPVCSASLTGMKFVPASSLESYVGMANDAERAWQGQVTRGIAPIGTALLVGVQIRIWWWQWVPSLRDRIVETGISFAPAIYEDGESWRLLTMGLLHSDLGHLAMNLLWLGYIGWNVERALGRANLFIIYFASVLGGSLLSAYSSPWTPSLGASGGVFGLIAATAVFGLTRPELLTEKERKRFGIAMVPYILITFYSGLQSRTTDNWAHFGGLVTGGALATLLDPALLERRQGWNRRVYAMLALFATVVMLTPVLAGPRIQPLVDSKEANRQAIGKRVGRVQTVVDEVGVSDASLHWSVPAGWQPSGVSSAGDLGFSSPMIGRVWSVREIHHNMPQGVDARAQQWLAGLKRSFPDLTVPSPRPSTLAGKPASLIEVRLPGRDGRVLEWRCTVRGHWSLEAAWEVPADIHDRLKPLHQRLLYAIQWDDPTQLKKARAGVNADPTSFTRRTELAEALSDVGEPENALELWQKLVVERPEDEATRKGLFQFLRAYPDLSFDVAPFYADTLARQPTARLIVELVATMEARGDPDGARRQLDAAWAHYPGDRDLKRARKAREMSVQLPAFQAPAPTATLPAPPR